MCRVAVLFHVLTLYTQLWQNCSTKNEPLNNAFKYYSSLLSIVHIDDVLTWQECSDQRCGAHVTDRMSNRISELFKDIVLIGGRRGNETTWRVGFPEIARKRREYSQKMNELKLVAK